MSQTIERAFHVQRRGRGTKSLKENAEPVETTTPLGRLPRVTRLMALAIHLDELLQSGTVKSQAELARVGHVSRARLTQIMNLLCLAPDIQERILFLPRTVNGRDPNTERMLRELSKKKCWSEQRQMF